MNQGIRTAGLGRRATAFAFDYAWVLGWLVVVVVIGVVVRAAWPDAAAAVFGDPIRAQATGFISVTLPISLAFAIAEASQRGATWGKRRMRLRVESAAGERIGLGRSLVRTALKFLPWELSHAAIWRFAFPESAPEAVPIALISIAWGLIGAYVVTALVGSRRTLYDRLSGTRVVDAGG